MKHARPDYDRIQDPAGLIPIDEPVFLLRGQDVHAPELVIRWAEAQIAAGGDFALVRMAFDQATAMRAWQRKRASKVPDLPASAGGEGSAG